MTTPANEARPENAVATDERIRADLARLLQERLLRESTLGVWVHPILIAVVVALAWPDAPHDLLLGWAGAVVFTALLRGAWIYVSSSRPLTERAVRTGVRATVTLLAITWGVGGALVLPVVPFETDRKSTRLNSSHSQISYAVFCLKKKKKKKTNQRIWRKRDNTG